MPEFATYEDIETGPAVNDSMRIRRDSLALKNKQRSFAKIRKIMEDNAHLFPIILSDVDRNAYIKEVILLMALGDAVKG